jgi:lipopolysaccharide/colanic/teichoic acid biosynthesis glycosyltransferase
MTQGKDWAKRALDLAIALPLFVITLPIQAVTALAIRIRLGSPVLFRQTRAGLHGEPFRMVKFRTMLNMDPQRGLTEEDDRSTPLGVWLRASSLDELPNLWNVIAGDMSLVGPRPLRMKYLGRYSTEQARRLEVRPGVTGLAQVSGRNAISWDDKFRLDVLYVDHHTFAGDLRIILRTLASVAERDSTTMPEFFGTSNQEQSP